MIRRHFVGPKGLLVVAAMVATILVGCGKKADSDGSGSMEIVNTWKTVDTPAGADPSVPDSLGGNGFEAIAAAGGWQTYVMTDADRESKAFGDPAAVTGGTFNATSSRYPLSFRPFFYGMNANFTENYILSSMCYQTLVGLHPITLEYIPGLASHWKVSEDKMTYTFRIDPDARFWDGSRVTAEDVVATYKLVMDPTLNSPSMIQSFEKFDVPVAVSKYIVQVRAKELNWRSFQTFGAGLAILKAGQINGMTGSEFNTKFHFELPIGSGEYIILPQDIKKEQSFTYTRRPDFWAANDEMGKYSGNFDRVTFTTILDNPTVEFETFKKGQSDMFYYTSVSIENWINGENDDLVKNNLIQKVRVKTNGAAGAGGIYFNMRKPPFDDIRLRQAFFYLYDREAIISKLLYNEYEPYDSFYAGGLYENASNVKYRYNPEKAKELLAQAGYTTRNSNGILTKNGKPLVLELSIVKPIEKFVTPLKQTLREAGIDLQLKFEDGNAITKNIAERNFTLTWANYGGLTFPNPESSYSSKLADQNDNNNITGIKNARIDQIIDEYAVAFDVPTRVRLIKELDGILMENVIAALTWNTKGIKLGYWNKFGMPEYVLTRTAQAGDHDLAVISLWWYDAAKAKALEEAKSKKTSLPGPGKIRDVRYWTERSF